MIFKYLKRKAYFNFSKKTLYEGNNGSVPVILLLTVIFCVASFIQLPEYYYYLNMYYYLVILIIGIVINLKFFKVADSKKIEYVFFSRALYTLVFSSFVTEFFQFLSVYEYYLNDVILIYLFNKILPIIIGYILLKLIILLDNRFDILDRNHVIEKRNQLLGRYIPTIFLLCGIIYIFSVRNTFIIILTVITSILVHGTFGIMAILSFQKWFYVRKEWYNGAV